jgi:hypothetical protein
MPRHALAIGLCLLLALGGAACGAQAQSSAPDASGAVDLEAARAELDHALRQLELIHPEPFHAIGREDFVAELEGLKSRLGELAPEQAATELMRIWALLATERDGHQFALPLDTEGEPVLPLKVYEFEEGVFVTAAMAPNENLAGSRLTAIGETPISEVLARIEPLLPRDGPATVSSFRPIYLLRAIVLRGLGIAGGGPIPVTVDDGGTARTVELEPVPASEFLAWSPGFTAFHGLAPRDGLRHTQPATEPLTVELLARERAVYVRYSQVQEVSSDELDELSLLGARRDVDRVVVDLRQNPGGNNFTYPSVLEALADDAIDRPGRLVVLTDRVTFSAASNFATEVEQTTSALFAGEPMGGGLNFWNDVDFIALPDFAVPMRVAVSTRYWQKSTPEDPRLTIQPELAVPVRAADYFAGRDALLEAVLAGEAR